MNKLAPIVLFVYNRPWHTRQTVEALLSNELAAESELIVFSDGAQKDNDLPAVEDVRNYLKTIEGFKSVSIHESPSNKDLSIFEYGCGTSTTWFSARVKDIVSCEHNKEWYEKIKERISDKVTLIYKDLDEGYSEVIKEYSNKFDIIFIDGRNRVACIKK